MYILFFIKEILYNCKKKKILYHFYNSAKYSQYQGTSVKQYALYYLRGKRYDGRLSRQN